MPVKEIDREAVRELVDSGEAVVAEALPPANYEDLHLPGAVNLPHDQVDALAPALLPDKARTVVVYCANVPCPNSRLAADRLVALGYEDVREYPGGKEDWVAAGLPTESGAAVR